jgi:hypothetical protein
MRNFRNLAVLLFILVTGFQQLSAQVRGQNNRQQYQRCATQEAIDRRYQTDPMFRAMIDQRERDFQRWKAEHPNGAGISPDVLTGPVVIPVVVHVVLPNPNIILESDVEYLINRLNLDFSGLNPDSTNGTDWYSVRGHSLIRFCLARRDPSGNFTNGIERRVGAGTIGFGEPQAIKSFAAGGLDPWNVTQYYNIWVGVGGGLLGIAPEIGPGTAASDGVCVSYEAFANNPCYTISAFNLGRTAVHEIGHNFGLYHTFQGGCANSDMAQLTSAGCSLPAPVLALTDDTPGQNNSTSGCPAGTAASGCGGSPTPPGRQYQNYMDYTDDACYSMFTNTQVERMHWVLENCRAGYLTSNGCSLPAGTPALDAAAIEVISPGGSDIVGCSVVNYNITCPGNFDGKVRVQNRGSSTITSVTVQVTITGAGSGTASVTAPVNLAYGKSAVVTITNPALLLGIGNNTVTFNITAVNGGADGNAANNSVATNANIAAATSLPLAENFVGATYPPTNFTINNPNGNNTWVRNNNGNGNAGSSFIDNYNFNLVGQIDEVRTVNLDKTGISYITVEFDLAHKNFPGFNDRLQVLYSLDCGATWLATSFDRSGAALATAGSSTGSYTSPAAGDWVRQTVNIDLCGNSASIIQIAWRNTNGYGNNIFIDNINVSGQSPSVNPPANQTVCNGSPTAAVNFTGSPVPGTVYNWTNNTTSIGLAASGTGDIASFNAVNTGTSPVVATITVTPVAGACSGTPVTFTITVNPTPTVNAVSNQTVCNGAPTAAVNFTGAVAGTIFNWTNNTPSIGLAASGTGNIGSFNAINTGTTPVTATITVTPTTNSASFSQTFNFTGAVQTWVVPAGVTSINIQAFGAQGNNNAAGVARGGLGGSANGTLAVTPGETLNLYVGGGGTTSTTGGFNGGGNGGTTGTCTTAPGGGGGGASDVRKGGTALSNRVIVAGGGGGTAGNRVAGCARGAGGGGGGGYYGGGGGSGYPGIAGVIPGGGTQAAGGAGGVTGTTFGATNGAPGSLGNGGTGGNEIFSNQAGSLAVAFNSGNGGGATGSPGAQSGANDFTGQGGAGGSSYIGGVTGGSTSAGVRSGNGAIIISYTLPIVPVICTGTPRTFTITVNPTPNAVATPTLQTICSGASITPITITGGVAGTTFNWVRNNTATATGIAASGSGNISGTLTNTTNAPVTVAFTITPVANGCTGTSVIVNVVVNPNPVVNPVASRTVCNGSTVPSIAFSSPTTGGTIVYNWTNSNTAIGLGASGSGNLPSFTATNATTGPISGTITVTPTYTNVVSCVGTPITFTITVAPTPTVDPVANQTVCNGSMTAPVNFTSPIAGTTFSWTNSLPSIGLAASGTGNIAAFTATNPATTPVTATVTVTPNYTVGSPGSITLPAQTSTFTGNVRGYWFTAPTSFTMTSLFVPTDASTGAQSIAVLRFNGAAPPPVFPTTTNAFTTLFLTQNNPAAGAIPVSIPVVAGDVIGIMGYRATVNSYSAGPNNIVIAGLPVSLVRMGMQFPLTTTAPQQIWQEPASSNISRVLFDYTTAVTCPGTPRSFTITVNPTPTITCPANITVPSVLGACNAAVSYTPTVTGTPAPTLSYTFSGATTGSGSGSGSGSLFNVGMTTVTVTATNICGTVSCSFTVTVTDSQIPVISAQPANRTVCAGTNATFSVTATANGGPIAYQWQQWNGSAWVNITGANTSSYTVNNATVAMNTNSFRVVLTGLCTVVNSGVATLYVNALPSVSIATSRAPQLLPTHTLNLTAIVNPGGGAYQWFKNNVAIPGATGSSLNNLTVDDQGTYRVRYTDLNGCISTSSDLVVSALQSGLLFIYPNPNNGLFHVRFFNASGETATVSIFDAKGALAFRKVVTTGNPYTDITIDLAGRNASGVYMVEVRGNNGRLIGAEGLFINNGQ